MLAKKVCCVELGQFLGFSAIDGFKPFSGKSLRNRQVKPAVDLVSGSGIQAALRNPEQVRIGRISLCRIAPGAWVINKICGGYLTLQEGIVQLDVPFFLGIARLQFKTTGFLDGMLKIVPGARVGHVGLYRDPHTLESVEYFFKAPQNMHERDAIVVDAMLATGNSAVAAITRIKQTQPKSIKFMCLLACPEGISNMREAHPDVHIYTAAIDRQLNEDGYILPGLGDAGDRIFGTK